LPVLVAAAVFVGGTRLIDNVLLEEPETAAP
jgi:pantothenate synthetase